jgi:hypothetical protein
MNRISITFLAGLIITTACAQADTSFHIRSGANLLYIVNADQVTKSQFLIPHIESELKHIITPYKKETIFSRVTNLNLALSAKTIRLTLGDIARYFNRDQQPFTPNRQMSASDSLFVGDLVKSFEYFLIININTLNTNIEYQFILYRIFPNNGFSVPIPDQTNYRAVSFFIDPLSPDYKEKIKFGLKQLIHEANAPPEIKIIQNNSRVADSVMYVQKNTLFFADIIALDIDSDIDRMHYRIQVRNTESGTDIYQTSNNLIRGEFKIEGESTMSIDLSDGISSAKRLIHIHPIDQPLIKIFPKGDLYVNDDYKIAHLWYYGDFFNPDQFYKGLSKKKKDSKLGIISSIHPDSLSFFYYSPGKTSFSEDSIQYYPATPIYNIERWTKRMNFGDVNVSLAYDLKSKESGQDSTRNIFESEMELKSIDDHGHSTNPFAVTGLGYIYATGRNRGVPATGFLKIQYHRFHVWVPCMDIAITTARIDSGKNVASYGGLGIRYNSKFRYKSQPTELSPQENLLKTIHFKSGFALIRSYGFPYRCLDSFIYI